MTAARSWPCTATGSTAFISTLRPRRRRSFPRAYAFTQRWLSRRGEWPKRLDRAHVGLSSLSHQVEDGARGYASEQRVDVIVCGHTHRPGRKRVRPDRAGRRGIEYFNTGCWVDRPASFVTVGAAGVALNHCP